MSNKDQSTNPSVNHQLRTTISHMRTWLDHMEGLLPPEPMADHQTVAQKETDPPLNAMLVMVNPQVTDAVTQSNVKVVGDSPAIAMGTIYQSLAHSGGLEFEDSINAQSQQDMLGQAGTTQGLIRVYNVDPVSGALTLAYIHST